MPARVWLILSLVLSGAGLAACAPLVGAGAVVVADEVAEEDGDDGLF